MMVRVALAFALALALAPSRTSAGHYYPETDDEKADNVVVREVDREPAVELGISERLGSRKTGADHMLTGGIAAEAGLRADRFALLGEYERLRLGDEIEDELLGHEQRFGASARYSIVRGLFTRHGRGVRGDVFVEAGIGEELVALNAGDHFHRADLSIEAGGSFRVRGTELFGGYDIAVRATFAEPPPGYTPVTRGLDHDVLIIITGVLGG